MAIFYFFLQYKDACVGCTDAAWVIKLYLWSPLSPLRSVLPTACRQQQNAKLWFGRLYYWAQIGFVKLFLFACSLIEVASTDISLIFFLPLNNLFFNKEEVFFSFFFFLWKKKLQKQTCPTKCSVIPKTCFLGKLSPLLGETAPTHFYVKFFCSFRQEDADAGELFFVCLFCWGFFSLQRGLLEGGLCDSPQRAVGILTMMGLQLLFMHLPCRPFTPGGRTSLHVYK